MISVINNKIMFVRLAFPQEKKYSHPYTRTPPLQIGYMISLLKKEYDIRFLDGRVTNYSLKFLLKSTRDFNPSVVVMSFTPEERNSALAYARKIKEFSPYIKIICIGPYASVLPQTLIFQESPIDFVLLGECELDLIDLIKSLDSPERLKRIRSLYFKEKNHAEIALIEDLDSLPMPAHSFFSPRYYFSIYPLPLNLKLKWGYILSSRGCPYQCIFCSPTIRTSYGSKMRFRSPKSVVEEMLYLRSLGINIISFEDDNFTASKQHTLELCREMINKKVNLPWIAHGRITDLSKEIMSVMKKAGCVLLKIGIESGSNRIINILSKTEERINWNKKTCEVFEQGKKINLSLHAMFIIGNPQETEEDLSLTINLIKQIKPESIQIHYFVPYPGSIAFDRYCHNQKFNEALHHYNPVDIINLSQIDTRRLKGTQRHIYRNFYLNPSFLIRHCLKYWRFYLHNPRVAREGIRGLMKL